MKNHIKNYLQKFKIDYIEITKTREQFRHDDFLNKSS